MAHPWAILTKSCIRCWSMSVAVVYVINCFELSDLVNMVCFWNRDSICYRTRALTTYGLAAAILDFRYEIMSVGYKDGRRTNGHSLKPNIWRIRAGRLSTIPSELCMVTTGFGGRHLDSGVGRRRSKFAGNGGCCCRYARLWKNCMSFSVKSVYIPDLVNLL